MLIWRGKGLFVLGIILLAAIIPVAISAGIAEQQFPNNDFSFDLFSNTSNWMFVIFGVGFLVGAFACWKIGRSLNAEGNEHALFFIPFQFWAIPMALFGALGALNYFGEPDISNLKSGFINACTLYEEDADRKECTCIANKLQAGTKPIEHIPFFSYLKDQWGSSEMDDDEVIDYFMETYAVDFPKGGQARFMTAMGDAAYCLD